VFLTAIHSTLGVVGTPERTLRLCHTSSLGTESDSWACLLKKMISDVLPVASSQHYDSTICNKSKKMHFLVTYEHRGFCYGCGTCSGA